VLLEFVSFGGSDMSFATLGLDELEPGVLLDAFKAGHVAAIIECGDLVETLWSLLLHHPEEKLPWELPLLDIAKNHVRGKDLPSTVGDVFYFQPGHHSYIARKLEIARADGPRVSPASFHQGGKQIAPSEELVNLCCSFVDRVMLSLRPAGRPVPDYKVAVQRLKYQGEWDDYQALTELIEDSLARWGRKGYALDALRGRLAAPLARKGVSDLAAMLMMMAGSPRSAGGSNDIARRQDARANVYEHSHVDYRYFTALCGCRDNVRTEVLVDGKWLELPVNLDAITVYPGTMGLKGTSVAPTVHRVVHTGMADVSHDRASNVTVLLGAA
jgi:hypothetical protein